MINYISMLLAAFFILNSCATPKDTEEIPDQFREKFDTYLSLSGGKIICQDDCDSLTFNGFFGSVPGIRIDLSAFRAAPGLYLRRPITEDNCYETGESSSECSKDTHLALFTWLWRAKWIDQAVRLDMAQEIWDRGIEKDWVMCEGDSTRTKLSRSLIGTLAWLIFKLGGGDHSERTNPSYTLVIDPLAKGFLRHLAANHADLRADLTGRMAGGILSIIAIYADQQPKNPLYRAIYQRYWNGEQSGAIDLLMDESHWPADRLPTSSEHCEQWLIQRDDGSDWDPCPEEGKTHSGGDWLWTASIILR